MRTLLVVLILSLTAGFVACSGKTLSRQEVSEEAELNRCLRFSAKKRYQQAIDCFEVFKSRYPASARTAEAELRIGDSYFRKKEYLLAAESYQHFIRLHPVHERVDYATYRLGLSYLYDTPPQIDRDQGSLPDAIDALQTVWQAYPESPYAKIARLKYNEAKAKAASHEFYVARFYFRTQEYRAALPRLNTIMQEYARTSYAKEAAYLSVRAHLELSEQAAAEQAFGYLEERFPKDKLTLKAAKALKRRITL